MHSFFNSCWTFTLKASCFSVLQLSTFSPLHVTALSWSR